MARNTYRDDPAFLFELHFTLYRKEYGPSNVTIRAWEAPQPDDYRSTGHTRIDAQLLWNGKPICRRGEIYCGIPAHKCIDSDYAKEAVVSLFCDADYLERDESPELQEWIAQHGETLGCEKLARFGEDS